MMENLTVETGDLLLKIQEGDDMKNENILDIHSYNPGPQRGDFSYSGLEDFFGDATSASRSVFQIKFYKELSIARSFDEFSTRIKKILEDLGFGEYAFSRTSATGEIPRPIITMPDAMNDVYFREGFYEHDLALQCAMNDNGPIFHSVIEDYINDVPFVTDTITQNREIFKLLKSFGYIDFYFIPLGAHNGNGRVLLSVATKDKSADQFRVHVESCKDTLDLLAQAIDYVGTRKFPNFFLCENESQKIIITPKPLVLLNMLAQDDLTLIQTADKLSISIHTADKHISAVKKALGTSTIHGAIYKAIKVGLIDGK